MSRAPSQAGSRAPSAARDRRSSSVHPPSRRASSALEEHSNTAVTRAIYHHARECLKRRRERHADENRCRSAVFAICQGTRAVILESTVVQIVAKCVARTRQLQAKHADERWKMLDSRLFFGCGLESAMKVSEALGEILLGFEGQDDVKSRFLNLAKSFDQSEVSLRQLQQSFGDNLDGLQAMRDNFDRCTEEVIRLVSLLEGDCASMRVQLRQSIQSPRVSRSLPGSIAS